MRSIGVVSSASLAALLLVSPASASGSAVDTLGSSGITVDYPQPVGSNRLVSVRPDGSSTTAASAEAALSADGRFVAFSSSDPQLIAGQTITGQQIYLRDRATGQTQLVSRAGDGSPGNNTSREADISADGTRVVYSSDATNLVGGDTNALRDIFLFDATEGTTRLVSGDPGTRPRTTPAISADGEHIVYAAKNDIYAFAVQDDRPELITTPAGLGPTGALYSDDPDISADGDRIVYWSDGNNLTRARDRNAFEDVFLYDSSAATTIQLTRTTYGHSYGTSISADGKHVAFHSRGDSFTGEPVLNELYNIWTVDLVSREFQLVTTAYDGGVAAGDSYDPELSADGTRLTWWSAAPNLVRGDTNGAADVFAHSTESGATRLLSRPRNGPADDGSSYPDMSDDGTHVAYTSFAENLVGQDDNNVRDVFVYRLS